MPQQHPEAGLLLTESVRALVLAWKQLAAYPPGHPACAAALENAHRRLTELVAAEGPIAFGVGRKTLLCGETELASPLAQRLARALYERDVAVLGIDPGIEMSEIEVLLRLLTSDPRQRTDPPLWNELAAAGVRHVYLQLVDYSSVEMTDEVWPPESPEPEPLWDDILRGLLAGKQLSERPGSLWDDIFRALLGGEALPNKAEDTASYETLSGPEVASLIAGYLGATDTTVDAGTAPDAGTGSGPAGGVGPRSLGQSGPSGRPARLSAIIAARLANAVGSHLATVRGPACALAARQVAELVRALPAQIGEVVLYAALQVLASDDGAAEALGALSSTLRPDTILMALQRLSQEGTRLSRHALRLTRTLSTASTAPADAEGPDPEAPSEALLAELRVLFRGEDIDRFNPDDHKALLDRVSVELPVVATLTPRTSADLGDRIDSVTDDSIAEQIAQTLLELLSQHTSREGYTSLLSRLEDLVHLLLMRGRLDPATETIEAMQALSDESRVPPDFRAALQESLGRMATQETLSALIEAVSQPSERVTAMVRRLVARLGAVAITNLLGALIEEPSRSRRRRIFELLVSLGPAIVPEATARLSDPRWYVVRNMIALLRAVGDRSSLPGIERCALHPDLRVRLEALRTLLTLDVRVAHAMLERAINDPNPTLAESAIALAGRHRVFEAVDPLVRVVTRWDPSGRRRSIRLAALRVLGEFADPAVLPRLSRFFRNWLVPVVAIEERRAAFASLASYPEPARRPLVQNGLASRDPEIREMCRRLAGITATHTSSSDGTAVKV